MSTNEEEKAAAIKALEEIQIAFTTDPSSWSVDRNSRYEHLVKSIIDEEDRWLELTEEMDGITKEIARLE